MDFGLDEYDQLASLARSISGHMIISVNDTHREPSMVSLYQFKEGRRVTLLELAEATGISRVTLSKMVNQRGYGTLTDHLNKLCAYFGCRIEQLAEYVPDENITSSTESANY